MSFALAETEPASATEVVRCLRASGSEDAARPVLESPLHTHADSLRLIQMMDAFRAEWGILYPFEAKNVLRGASFGRNTSVTGTGASFGVGVGAGNARNATGAGSGANVRGTGAGNAGNAGAAVTSAVSVGAETNAANVPDNSAEPIVVYTDGACSGNPGRGGWGAVIIVDGKEHPMSGGEKLTTNNRMELMARYTESDS